ncbi:MAG: hypothetical protein ACRD8W_17820 [Nitrososphaeraceae archaeon]
MVQEASFSYKFDSNNFGVTFKMALPEIIQIIIRHYVYNDYMTHEHEHEHSHEDGTTHTHDHEKGEHHGREIEHEHEHSHEDGTTHTHDHEKGEHHGREIEN